MAIADSMARGGITVSPPKGGIVAEIAGRSYRAILRNDEIERFEAQHDLGIFEMLKRFLGQSTAPQARHVRDLVALGLVGGGMMDRLADDLVRDLPPSENFALRQIAADLVMIAFTPENPEKKSGEDGSLGSDAETDGMSPAASGASSPQD